MGAGAAREMLGVERGSGRMLRISRRGCAGAREGRVGGAKVRGSLRGAGLNDFGCGRFEGAWMRLSFRCGVNDGVVRGRCGKEGDGIVRG